MFLRLFPFLFFLIVILNINATNENNDITIFINEEEKQHLSPAPTKWLIPPKKYEKQNEPISESCVPKACIIFTLLGFAALNFAIQTQLFKAEKR